MNLHCFLLALPLVLLLVANANGAAAAGTQSRRQDAISRGERLGRTASARLDVENNNEQDGKPVDIIEEEPVAVERRPLKIAQVAPLYESVPPKTYGGTERVVYYLTEELVRQGHNVTLFASYDSKTSARLISNPALLSLRLHGNSELFTHITLMEDVRKHADEFDIIHGHNEGYFFLLNMFPDKGGFVSLHGQMNYPMLTPMLQKFPHVPLVSISDDQRTHTIDKEQNGHNYVGTVHHGIPRDLLPFKENPKLDYLAFLGRITEVKRPDWAIKIAIRTGIPLRIAAKVDNVDKAYWEREIKPLVERHSDLVQFVGEINEQEKAEFLGNAKALLFPIDWPEPFGLVMIEAMSCGTPVIARRNGSVPEVVDHGVTGFIFDTLDEAVDAVRHVPELNRTQIRRVFERRFTAERMANDYLRLYRKFLQKQKNGGGGERKTANKIVGPFHST